MPGGPFPSRPSLPLVLLDLLGMFDDIILAAADYMGSCRDKNPGNYKTDGQKHGN